jgi:phage baseplate assembly protein W
MSISVILPMSYDESLGFSSFGNTQLANAIKQNLKFLLFTIPGEYVNDINFGIGIQMYLFENHLTISTSEIRSKILQQTSKYMPYIKIESIDFDMNPDSNRMGVQIKFYYNNNLTIPEVANFFVN